MLRQFTVNNFKSLINVTYEPGAVNLLIGVNNSGKTNLCQALRFLSQTAREQEGSLLGAWCIATGVKHVVGGKYAKIKNAYFDHPTVDLGCTCDLVVDDETLTFRYSINLHAVPAGLPVGVVAERLEVSGGKFGSGWTTLLENKRGEVRLLNEQHFVEGHSLDACYQSTSAGQNARMLYRLHDWRANQRAMAFRDYLAGWQYYDLDPYRLREDQFDPQAHTLSSDGANLASALFLLKSQDERRYRRFIKLTQKVEQRLDALNFETAGEHIEMALTDRQDHRFSHSAASSGTLRFMALCYIVLNNSRQSNSPLTIIEEPENGLYVRYLKPLFELIDPMGKQGQYIFTSHSPYFIDLFDANIEDIVLMQDRATHSVLLKPDPAQARKYLEEMPLGELHFREMLA